MRETCVLLLATLMILSTVVVSSDTNNDTPEIILAGADYISKSQQTNTFDLDWIHFDDGTNVNAVGLTASGTFEFAARFTPDELEDWGGYQISVVRHHHGWSGDEPFLMLGNIKIYGEGTSTQPGSLITSDPFQCYSTNWFDVDLSEPVQITGDEDIWVSIEATHEVGQCPAGCDDGPMVNGKGGWIRLGGQWSEIKDLGINVNWNIWAEVEIPSKPPEKPQRPDGPTEGVTGVEYTFSTSTTDPEGDDVYYMWDWGDGNYSEWIGPFDSGATAYASYIWNASDDYNITVKAKDVHHDGESDWSEPKPIHIAGIPVLEIDNIAGMLFKVRTVIKNTGGVDAVIVNWNITLHGGLILLGRVTSGSIVCIPAGDEATINSGLIFGFGKTTITVSVEISESSDTKERDAFVVLFFIL